MNSLKWALNLERDDCHNPLLLVFFSEMNYNHLHCNITRRVKEETGQEIASPDKQAMLISMMNAYKNIKIGASTDIKKELTKLNNIFFRHQVKTLVQGLEAYKDYYKHASSLPVPLERASQADRIKGTKVLRNKFLTNQTD